MKYTVCIANPKYRTTTFHGNSRDIHDKIYGELTKNGIEHELAADCASWCELATVGESYNEEDFDVYVEEE